MLHGHIACMLNYISADERKCYINSHLINDSRNFYEFRIDSSSPTLPNIPIDEIFNVKMSLHGFRLFY